jgi:hypothetical protein
MFEHRSKPLLPRREYFKRLVRCALVGLALIGVSLLIGMLGYHLLENFSWLDAFVNASMLLGGMGPVDPLRTAAGKVFAGIYALYCGFTVLAVAGIIFAPVVHRALHRFHLEDERS